MNTAIKFDRQSTFKAAGIDYPVFDAHWNSLAKT
jgi:hypothetical protein